MKNDQDKHSNPKDSGSGLLMAYGAGAGVALGAGVGSAFGEVALGAGIGTALGAAAGTVLMILRTGGNDR